MRLSYLKLVILAASFFGFAATAPLANAAYIASIQQVGSNVVVTGSGSINLTALIPGGPGSLRGACEGNDATLEIGPSVNTSASGYLGFTGPATFGTGGDFVATSGSGDMMGISNFSIPGLIPVELFVPAGYVTGSSLSDTSTFSGQTLSSLGLTLGTYTYNWGTGATADTFTVQVGTAVPEPASLSLLGIGGLGLLRRRAMNI